MRYTGYVLLAIAGILVMYVIANTLIFDVREMENAGVANAGPASRGSYWLALIPAGLSAIIGLRMAMARDKGYSETYDLRQQQT